MGLEEFSYPFDLVLCMTSGANPNRKQVRIYGEIQAITLTSGNVSHIVVFAR